ncbi:MAG: NUDIX domain-containing protein [Candidatus Uhrbacteria bacterium]|nr:NUDIX domain-containing protein [Candidatus Uhrbacteria bacterium]
MSGKHPIAAAYMPKRCRRCDALLLPHREGDPHNKFVCSLDEKHERWVQSGFVAYVIPLDPAEHAVVVRRGIPPAVGGLCFPGGYIDYGDTAEETVVHEAMDEACVKIDPNELIYLGQWFEPGPGVLVMAFIAYVAHADVLEFDADKIPNHESTERLIVDIHEMKPTVLAFNGNRLALAAARRMISR